MSGHDDVLRIAGEMEELAKEMLNRADALRTAHCRAIMRQSERQTASPRVVAGPLRLVEETRILTHPTCAIPGASCDDEPPGAA